MLVTLKLQVTFYAFDNTQITLQPGALVFLDSKLGVAYHNKHAFDLSREEYTIMS